MCSNNEYYLHSWYGPPLDRCEKYLDLSDRKGDLAGMDIVKQASFALGIGYQLFLNRCKAIAYIGNELPTVFE